MLRAANLSVRILNNLSFSLEEGENLTILGANGSGKTTLAKALCGLIPTDAVYCDDLPVAALSPKKRNETFHFVPAKLHVYDEYLSVSDYLHLCAPLGKIDTALEELGLSPLRESRCAELSSGESALLMVAGAMMRGARYTIFDEPTANLDPINKVKLYRLLKTSLRFKHRLLITHDLNLAHAMGSPILYLERGEERFFGSCDEFFSPGNLARCFGDSISRQGDHFMVNYDENR